MATSGEELRTFVAVELPEDVLAEIGRVQRALAFQLQTHAIRWARPEGTHLTLKFLGDTPADAVHDVESRLGVALAGFPRFQLSLGPLGVFPSARAPRVVWVGLSGDLTALEEAHRRVESAVSPLGYPTEQRPFSPHLTLGRVADHASDADRGEVGTVVGAATPPAPIPFEVRTVGLIRSELGPGGARYSSLFRVPLS